MKNVKLTKVALMVLLLMLCVPTESVYAQSNNTQEMASKLVDGLFGKKKKKKKDKKKDNEEKETTETAGSVIGDITKEKDDIELVVWGNGANKEEATKVALRSAIEQTFGTFVSSNTQILNDELVKDEVATISSGNIKSYKYISENVVNGTTEVSIKAVISIGKLITYAQSKGSSAELAGATFAMNVKMAKLNAENERMAIDHLFQKCKAMLPYIFDYEIVVGEPEIDKFHERKGRNHKVPITIIVKPNDNARTCHKLFHETMRELSLPVESILAEAKNSDGVIPIVYEGYTERVDLGYITRVLNGGEEESIRSVMGEYKMYVLRNGISDYLLDWRDSFSSWDFQINDGLEQYIGEKMKAGEYPHRMFKMKAGQKPHSDIVGVNGFDEKRYRDISSCSLPILKIVSDSFFIKYNCDFYYNEDEISKITGFNVSRIE